MLFLIFSFGLHHIRASEREENARTGFELNVNNTRYNIQMKTHEDLYNDSI